MKKIDEERMNQLSKEIDELDKERAKLRIEFQDKDTERYNEWSKIMTYYNEKINIVQEVLNTRRAEFNRLEKLKYHKRHEWIKDASYNWKDEQFKTPIQERYKCSICYKTKMKRVKLKEVVI